MEIALHTGERFRRSADSARVDRKPRGSIVVAITDDWIKRKWVEKFGYMMHPDKRNGWPTMQHRDPIIADWKHTWFDAWRDMEILNLMTPAEAWAVIVRSGVPDLGKDPSATLKVTDCWIWTRLEKKLFLIGRTDHDDDAVDLGEKGVHRHGGDEAIGPRFRIDYQSDLPLSRRDIMRAEDPEIEVEPDLEDVWSKTLIRQNFATTDIILPKIGGPDGR